MASQDRDGGFAYGQLAQAFVTALTHEDAATRQRAQERGGKWARALQAIADGTVRVGSRAPVRGLPAWVTPEVLRGGFASGEPLAGGPLTDAELELAVALDVAAERRAVFDAALTPAGLELLHRRLRAGDYAVGVPEEAALLVVAWLVGRGEPELAAGLVRQLAPQGGRLRFVPPSGGGAASELVWRETVGDVDAALRARRPRPAVEAQREALAVWAPFGDEVLALWLETEVGVRVAAHTPEGWRERAVALLARYDELAFLHTRCTKHRRPKENLAVLLTSLRDAVESRDGTIVRKGRLQTAVDGMVAKRGRPGGDGLAGVRAEQAVQAALPSHATLAHRMAARLDGRPHDAGLPDVEDLLVPFDDDAPVPPSVAAVVRRGTAGTPEELVAAGLVPSAEVLAGLLGPATAAQVAAGYGDGALSDLVAAAHRAFQARRSLLLVDLAAQVRFEELPWIAALAPFRREGREQREGARAALARFAGLTVETFPGTLLPNPVTSRFKEVARGAGVELPMVEELAADIFMGRFSRSFLEAAHDAGGLLAGTLYARYYGIEYAALPSLDGGRGALAAFSGLLVERAGGRGTGRSVAANGQVVEQGQIVTTHNLAPLVTRLGVRPAAGSWAGPAAGAFREVVRCVARVEGSDKPLHEVKNAAYAWRQALFFAALTDAAGQDGLARTWRDVVRREPRPVRVRLVPVLDGLDEVASGRVGRRDDAGTPSLFTGWTVGPHWMGPPSTSPAW